jgi:hypothetical protein
LTEKWFWTSLASPRVKTPQTTSLHFSEPSGSLAQLLLPINLEAILQSKRVFAWQTPETIRLDLESDKNKRHSPGYSTGLKPANILL